MFQIFIGSVFILFNINVSKAAVDILPDFIGWFFMAVGLARLSKHSKVFYYVQYAAMLMMALGLAHFVLAFFGNENPVYCALSDALGKPYAKCAEYAANIFWLLEAIVMTFLVLSLKKIKDRVADTVQIERFKYVCFTVYGIELTALLYKYFIMDYLPKPLRIALLQVLVIGAIFFKVCFLFSQYKISKDYKPY